MSVKMSVPALRKPKFSEELNGKIDQQFMILTLKNGMKLVVSSDSFHGIIMMGKIYKCVFCNVEMNKVTSKQLHKDLADHRKSLHKFSYVEELSENLVRQINKHTCYCTICNVTTSPTSLMHHIKTDGHMQELNRAILRASTYKPLNKNNNNK